MPMNNPSVVSGGGNSEREYTRVAWDTVAGSGPLNGQATDSGQLWQTGGAGYLTTVINPAGYIEGTQNTYCHINVGSKVYRAVQRYSGPGATISIGLDTSLTNMIHCIFGSGSASCTHWKTGVGSGVQPQWVKTVATVPTIDDNVPHELVLEVIDNTALAYVDGVLVLIAYHSDYSTLQGNYAFGQIGGAGSKIYSVEYSTLVVKSATEKRPTDSSAVKTNVLTAATISVGNPASVGFAPKGPTYFHTSENSFGHVFGSDGQATVQARAEVTGYGAMLRATSFLGLSADVFSAGDGTMQLRHQNTTKLSFPFNITRTDSVGPVQLPTYTVATLPSAATFARCVIYVSDGTSNKRLAISDGTNWRWPDGAVVS